MANDALKEIYIEHLKDLYNAESQLVKPMPKMVSRNTWNKTRNMCSVWKRFSRNWKDPYLAYGGR